MSIDDTQFATKTHRLQHCLFLRHVLDLCQHTCSQEDLACMRNRRPAPQSAPQQFDSQFESYLGTHLPPSTSRVPSIYRETTKCYAYMCTFAYGCSEQTQRPSQVLMRRCMRYMPETLRIKPALSDHALDVLAGHRETGHLSGETTAILDRLRPNGPKRPAAAGV